MSNVGIVLRQNLPEFQIVSQYYAAAKGEPTKRGRLPIDMTATFNNQFKHLCEQILAFRRSHVVIVAHGSTDMGLIMPLAPETKVSAGYCMPKLVSLVDTLQRDGTLSSATLMSAAKDWSVSEQTARLLAQTCLSIRRASGIAVAVHVRGCNIGADTRHLHALRKLFRSTVVSAPTCPMFYIPVRPNPMNASAYAKRYPRPRGRRWVYESAGLSPLLLDVEYLGAKTNSYSALEKSADVRGWAKVMHENPSSAASTSFVVAGLWPKEGEYYYLAHETDDYASLLAAVRVT